MSMSRRAFLLTTATAAASAGSTVLSACGSRGNAPVPPSGKVEVFSWWTSGAGIAGFQALLADFALNQPEITAVNPVAAGTIAASAQSTLAKRLAAGNPPDSFQSHAGAELSDHVAAGRLEKLDFLYRQQGWTKNFPAELLQLTRIRGAYYSVPVNIQRTNMLWSNPKVVKAAGADPEPKTFAAFLESLHKVRRAGLVPLAVADASTLKHALETVLLATLGAAGWSALWRKGADWSSPQVGKALENFHQLLSFANLSAATPSWEAAAALVSEGRAAYQITGDWVESQFKAQVGAQAHVDYAWAPVPGTAGVFQFLSDSFTLPKHAKNRDAALAWLKECGSKSGQLGFNSANGSIPALANLTADDRALFGEYPQWSMDQWKSCTVVGSLTHGVVAGNAWNAAIDAALADFVQSRQVPPFQRALAAAAREHAV